jgi:hypothetical protein
LKKDKAIQYIQPLADWIEEMENFILSQGRFLSDEEITIAQKLGIKKYDNIRVLESDIVPMPTHKSIKNMGSSMGFFKESTAGMSFRYGIFLNSTQKYTVEAFSFTNWFIRFNMNSLEVFWNL